MKYFNGNLSPDRQAGQTTEKVQSKISLKCSCEGGRQFRTPVVLWRIRTFRDANEFFSSLFPVVISHHRSQCLPQHMLLLHHFKRHKSTTCLWIRLRPQCWVSAISLHAGVSPSLSRQSAYTRQPSHMYITWPLMCTRHASDGYKRKERAASIDNRANNAGNVLLMSGFTH